MHHRWRPFLTPTVLVLSLGLLLTACITEEPPADDNENNASSTPQIEARFVQPDPGQPDDTLGDHLTDLLERTPEGATVRGAFFTFSREPIAQALVDAHERQVDVELVLGNTSRYPGGDDWQAVQILRDALGDKLTICREGQSDGGCLGESLHHNKFLTVSELDDGTEDIVVQSSGNATDFERTQYDNIVTFYDDPSLYEAFTSYWQDLQSQQLDLDYNRVEEGDGPVSVYFSPFNEYDPVLQDLEQVDCDNGGELYLAMAFFTDWRSDVAAQIRQMDQAGCQIHVILRGSDINSPGQQIMGLLRQGDVDMGYFPEGEQPQLHSKYLAYQGIWGDGEEPTQVVWTGSHNYTRSALLENDEVLLRIEDDAIFDAYRDDWNFIRDRAETHHP